MAKYIKLFTEFSSFINEKLNEFSEDHDKKLLNIILSHFDEITEAGTSHGKRARLINALILKHGLSASTEIELEEKTGPQNKFPFKTLNELHVENFRGFSQPEKLTFEKKFGFIYGQNGSGKSSLCEAIEYSLLGYVNEAISKNIDIDQYIKNSMTGKSVPPILIGKDADGNNVRITKNQQAYNFLFVEKCRIENFSRISSNSPSKKQNLIATLFGLDEFNEFVNKFTDKIEKYLDVIGIKSAELSRKTEALKVHKENISKSNNELLEINKEKQQILTDLELEITFDDLDELVHKPESGKLAVLEKELQKPAKTKITVQSLIEINKLIVELNRLQNNFLSFDKSYAEKKDKVQFKDLYTASLKIEELIKDKCPVCFTPVEKTTQHPYEHAK